MLLITIVYVDGQYSYDEHLSDASRIYRIGVQDSSRTGLVTPVLSGLLGPEIRSTVSGVEEVSRLVTSSSRVRVRDDFFQAQRVVTVDPGFVRMFFSPSKVDLNTPFTALITLSTAARYFGDSDPVGKTITIFAGSRPDDYTVVGVVDDSPYYSHVHFDVITSFATIEQVMGHTLSWQASMFYTYVMVRPGAHVVDVGDRVRSILLLNDPAFTRERMQVDMMPLRSIHLTETAAEIEPSVSPALLTILIALSVLVTLSSIFNYSNMNTVSVMGRIKEFSIRRILGGLPSDVTLVVFSEILARSLLSVVLGGFAAVLAIRGYESATGMHSTMAHFGIDTFVYLSVFLGLLITVLCSIAPLVLVASVNVPDALKGHLSRAGSSRFSRRVLIVGQLAITSFVLIGTLVVIEQRSRMVNSDTGIELENLIAVDVPGAGKNARKILDTGIDTASILGLTTDSRGTGFWASIGVRRDESDYSQSRTMNYFDAGPEYFKLMHIPLIFGEDIPPYESRESDDIAVLNETAAALLGWETPQDAVGERVFLGRERVRVIAVSKDYNLKSMHSVVSPTIVRARWTEQRRILMRTVPGGADRALDALETVWKQALPGIPFESRSLKTEWIRQYDEEAQIAFIATIVASVLLLVSIVGIISLSLFATQLRIREYGIRRILGATKLRVYWSVIMEYVTMMAVGLLLAIPAAYYSGDLWLQNYAYQSAYPFSAVAYAAVGIAILTVLSVSFAAHGAISTSEVDSISA